MQSNERLVYLFEKYITKTYTQEEKDELMVYINDHTYEDQLRELLGQSWEMPLPEYNQPETDAKKIFQNITGQPAVIRSRVTTKFLLRYAAVAIIVLSVGVSVYYFTNNPKKETRTGSATTLSGEHQYIVLPDGSKVLLNAGSKIDYSNTFNDTTREVHLSGEAYFDIVHDVSKPFVVYAGNIKTIVMGTAFNIKAFPGSQHTVITVTRGKVRVVDNEKVLDTVIPDQQLTVNGDHGGFKKESVNAEQSIAWKQDDILYDDILLKDAVADLEKRFKATILLQNKALGNCHITASFLHHESLEEIINVLVKINGMHYQSVKNGIVLNGEGCN